VTLSIAAPTAVILVSQTALTFTAVAQGGSPLPQTFGILNTGQGTLNWIASAQTLSGGSNWLQISATNGTVAQPFLDVSLVSVSINPIGWRPELLGQIQISAVASNTPQVLTVTLNVLAAGSTLGPDLQPSGLIFTGVAGANPSSQDVTVGNPLAQTANFISGSLGKAFSYCPPAPPCHLRSRHWFAFFLISALSIPGRSITA